MLGARLKLVCDLNEKQLAKVKEEFRGLETTADFDRVLEQSDIDAVAIATSAGSHYDLAKRALSAGKHVYVEKPMTLRVDESKELVELSEKQGRLLMVGHILVYHPAVQKIRQLIESGQLGQIFYLYAQRLNLGKVRLDENAMWSFAPHDLSVIFYLLGGELEAISAYGQSFLSEGVEDVVFLNLKLSSGPIAHVHLSWLDPHKRRMLTIVGSKKMVVFDDMETQEKIRIYDKGVEMAGDYRSYGEYYQLRFGDILIPKIDMQEPLYLTCRAFVEAIEKGAPLKSTGKDGLKVVQALNLAQKSLKLGGQPVLIGH
jgi:predicted dehydrogenase